MAKPETEMDLITAVVRYSRAEATLQAALKAGAPGITYTWARGTGVRQNLGFAGSFIESEKQVLWVVVPRSKAAKVIDAIAEAGNLQLPGEGFAYVQPVDRVVGFIAPKAP